MTELFFHELEAGKEAWREWDIPRAINHFMVCFHLDPKNWETNLFLAMSFLKLDQLEEAVDHAGRALDAAPQNPNFLRFYHTLKDRKAIKAQALERRPKRDSLQAAK